MNLEEKITQLTNTPSDINEHIPTLVKYASECDYITEMGVRGIISTWAFIAGKPNELRCYDIQHPTIFGGNIEEIEKICSNNMIDFKFTKANVLDIEIDYTDLLFIDTWHAYKQLKAELKLHSPKVNKYIILHDTTSYENRDEVSYEMWGEEWKAEGIGIWRAVEEFIKDNEEWSIKERYTNNNGLTILERNGKN
jgi:hypothetical protein